VTFSGLPSTLAAAASTASAKPGTDCLSRARNSWTARSMTSWRFRASVKAIACWSCRLVAAVARYPICSAGSARGGRPRRRGASSGTPPPSLPVCGYAEYMKLSNVNSSSAVQGSAIEALGWHEGHVVEVDLLGARLVVSTIPVHDEIERRRAVQLPPIPDPWLLRCHADLDPGFLSRPAPVRFLGALAWRQTWSAARNAACTFTAFGPRAVVLPTEACRPAVLTAAAVTGVGIVQWDGAASSVLAPPGQPPCGPRTHVHRLVEEIVWDALDHRMRAMGCPMP